ARRLGSINGNPVERALAIRPISVESCERDCFSSEQVAALIGAAEDEWKTAILLGYYTGGRFGDCVNMRLENVDLALGLIDYVPRKTRTKNKRVVVPIHPSLLAHLEKLASTDQPETFLCPTLARKPSGGKNGLSTQFKRVMATARIDARSGPG